MLYLTIYKVTSKKIIYDQRGSLKERLSPGLGAIAEGLPLVSSLTGQVALVFNLLVSNCRLPTVLAGGSWNASVTCLRAGVSSVEYKGGTYPSLLSSCIYYPKNEEYCPGLECLRPHRVVGPKRDSVKKMYHDSITNLEGTLTLTFKIYPYCWWLPSPPPG